MRRRTEHWAAALITGGGSGIGLRLAETLSARGTAVTVFDLRIGDETRRRLGGTVGLREVDVTDGDALAAAVGEAAAGLGHPAVAINSAGVQYARPFEEVTEERFRRVVEVNLVGSRNFAAAVLPHLRPGDRLALIASLAGIVPNHGYTAYSASKFGVVGLGGALRLECRPRGIGVSVICPPEVETPMVDEERRTGDAVGLELKRFAGTLTVERAVDEILRGLQEHRPLVVPGRRARFTRRLASLAPGLSNATSDLMVRRALARR